MELVFIGTGCGVPSAKRASPCLAVSTRSETILIDSGPGALRQLERAGLTYNHLDFLLYTHFHPDHSADLIAFLFASRYWPGPGRKTPVMVFGATGLVRIYDHLKAAYGHWIEPREGRILFRELDMEQKTAFECGSVTVEYGPVPHSPQSIGYRLRDKTGSTLVVTGDTDYGPEVVELARKADLLVCECSFPLGMKVKGHLTPDLAGRLAREAGVKVLALTHFYPETENQDILGQVRREFTER